MKELVKLYPEAAEVVRSYFLNMLLDSLNDDSLPENFKEYAREKGVAMDNIIAMLESNPRNTFDVFDNHELYIQITGDNKNGWSWEVEGTVENPVCATRRDAENKAVEESFRILNEKLCQTQL